MKVALLGLSHPHSGLLLTTLENSPEVTSVSLWDADSAVVARPALPASRKGSPPTADLEGVLAQTDLAFAIVCVRHDQAAELSRRVVAAGKHLLAEKPVGLTSFESIDVQRAAERTGVVASVLYARRCHPCVVAARRLVQAGALGVPLSAEVRFPTTQVKFRQPESWLFRRSQSGGGFRSGSAVIASTCCTIYPATKSPRSVRCSPRVPAKRSTSRTPSRWPSNSAPEPSGTFTPATRSRSAAKVTRTARAMIPTWLQRPRWPHCLAGPHPRIC